jgi:hypothetical protein
MYLYSITINIDEDVRLSFLSWMKAEFIPLHLQTGLFSGNTFLELMNEEKSSGTTYSLQLFFKSINEFQQYEDIFLIKHQNLLYQKFPNKFVEFRTLLKQVE